MELNWSSTNHFQMKLSKKVLHPPTARAELVWSVYNMDIMFSAPAVLPYRSTLLHHPTCITLMQPQILMEMHYSNTTYMKWRQNVSLPNLTNSARTFYLCEVSNCVPICVLLGLNRKTNMGTSSILRSHICAFNICQLTPGCL